MKKSAFSSACLGLWERTRRFHLPAWIAFHLLILGLFALTTPIVVNSDLTSILPDSSPSRAVSRADRKMSAALNGGFYVLVGHRDFPTARKAAAELFDGIRGHPSLQAVTLTVDDTLVGRFQEFLYENRYRCLPPETLRLLESGDVERIAADAFQVVSSPLSVGALDHIELDPFLLSNRALQWFVGSGMLNNLAVGVKDGVLAAESGGLWYVLLAFRLKDGGVSTQPRGHVAPVLYSLAEGIGQRTPDLDFVYSGVPFHAYESASRAQTEIVVISAAATTLLVSVVALLFFSIMPLAATVLTMVMGIAAGLAATFMAFREVHLFTVVFGTSLIGISVDYAVVFFAEWMNPLEPRDGPSVTRRVLPGITIGLVTTLVSYVALLFAPFPLLQQMAVFSSVGLVSTFLSVIFIFPLLKPPTASAEERPDPGPERRHRGLRSLLRAAAPAAVGAPRLRGGRRAPGAHARQIRQRPEGHLPGIPPPRGLREQGRSRAEHRHLRHVLHRPGLGNRGYPAEGRSPDRMSGPRGRGRQARRLPGHHDDAPLQGAPGPHLRTGGNRPHAPGGQADGGAGIRCGGAGGS